MAEGETGSKLESLITKQLDCKDTAPLNDAEIRNYIYYGFSSKSLRPQYWKMLFNYHSNNKFTEESFYSKRRNSYVELSNKIPENSVDNISELIVGDLDRMACLKEKDYVSYKEPMRKVLKEAR